MAVRASTAAAFLVMATGVFVMTQGIDLKLLTDQQNQARLRVISLLKNRNTSDPESTVRLLASLLNQTDVADVFIVGGFTNIQLSSGYSLMTLFAIRGYTNALRSLLDAGSFVDIADNDGWTPLIHAAKNNRSDGVKVLLEHRADPNIKSSDQGNTALHWAATYGKVVIVQDLLAAGADPNLRNLMGRTPLLLSSSEGHTEVVRLLLKWNAGIDILSNDGVSSLIWAARNNHLEAVRLLLDAGADVNIRNLDYGDTALLWAVTNGNVDMVKELVAAGSDPNAQSKTGISALIAAAIKNKTEIASVLLLAGADINLRANDGDTALIEAALRDHKEMVKLLLEHCPDLTVFNNNRKTVEDVALLTVDDKTIKNLVFGHKNSTCIHERQIYVLGALRYTSCLQVQCCQGVWTPTGEVRPTCGRRCQTVGSPAGYCTLVENCPKLEREFTDLMAAKDEDVLATFVRSYGCGVRNGCVELCCPLAWYPKMT